MELSEIRRWQWMLMGALLGLLLGYALVAVGPDALVTGSQARRTSQTTFESELTAQPVEGHALISNITVYPDGPISLVKMTRFVNLEPDNRNSLHWQSQLWYYEARRPYSPLDWDMRTDVRVKPDLDLRPDGYQADNSWLRADGAGKMWRDPGTEGAVLNLSIAKGDYDVVIAVDDPKEAAALIVKFNNHPLAPFTPDPANPNLLQSTIPAADFDAKNARALSIARNDTPVHIHQIHVFNPTYTVRDYLDGMMAQQTPTGAALYPEIRYRYGWWVEPRALMWMSVGGSVLLIGIIWPTVLNLMVGAGFGPAPREKGVSLRNLKATPVPVAVATGPTEEDLVSLEQMEADLLKDLESDADAVDQPVGVSAAAPAPVRALGAMPAPPLAQAPAPKKDDTPKSFKGEYYPVARKAGGDDESKKPD